MNDVNSKPAGDTILNRHIHPGIVIPPIRQHLIPRRMVGIASADDQLRTGRARCALLSDRSDHCLVAAFRRTHCRPRLRCRHGSSAIDFDQHCDSGVAIYPADLDARQLQCRAIRLHRRHRGPPATTKFFRPNASLNDSEAGSSPMPRSSTDRRGLFRFNWPNPPVGSRRDVDPQPARCAEPAVRDRQSLSTLITSTTHRVIRARARLAAIIDNVGRRG